MKNCCTGLLTLTWFLASQGLAPGIPGMTPSPPRKPNIVILFVDDLGWGDVSYQRLRHETPDIDRLAAEGMIFTHAYAASPTCSPSRAAILTGRHPARLRIVRHIPYTGPDAEAKATDPEFHQLEGDVSKMPSRNWLPLEEKTFAEALKEFGYRTAFFGKWHLGHGRYQPQNQGFDLVRGATPFGSPRSYYAPFWQDRSGKFLSEVYRDVPEGTYISDKLTDDAVAFLKEQDRRRPFLLTLFYYNVHTPNQGRQDFLKKYAQLGFAGAKLEKAAQVAAVNESVGRIGRALKEMDLDDGTVILFASDQGSFFTDEPYRGGKPAGTALYEGGARIPFFVRWPGVVTPGTASEATILTTDVFPTLVDMAGGNASRLGDLDGLSLLPLLTQTGTLKREHIVMYRSYDNQYAAVRSGRWKLIAYHDGSSELFDLEMDPFEARDLSAGFPDRVADLRGRLAVWEKEMGVSEFAGVAP